MPTAFVLSGGASLGAVQVGMLQALVQQGIVPDLLVGTSAGALNAAYLAGHGARAQTVEDLANIWRNLRIHSLFPIDARRAVGAVLGRTNAISSDRGLNRLLRQNLAFARMEDATIPLVVVATEVLTGVEVAIDRGNAYAAVLASCAIPGVFPPVWIDGRPLADGGLANNTALSHAVKAGAETIYVLPSGYACALPSPPQTAFGAAAHAMAILTHQRLLSDIELYRDKVRLIVLRPPCPIAVSPLNFGRAGELIASAFEATTAVLARNVDELSAPGSIGFHSHRSIRTFPR